MPQQTNPAEREWQDQNRQPIRLSHPWILTPEKAAAHLGVTVEQLAHWREAGRGPLFISLINRSIRYLKSDVEPFAAGFQSAFEAA
jgi:hypothetical protein